MAILHWSILLAGAVELFRRCGDVRRFLFVVIATLPFNGLFIEFGQRFELFKLACLLGLPIAAIQLPRMVSSGALRGLTTFAAWSLVITLITCIYQPEYLSIPGDGIRSMGVRICLQFTLLAARFALVGMCVIALSRCADVFTCLRMWLAATTVLAGFGLVEECCHFLGFEIGGVFYGGLLDGPTHLFQTVFGIGFKRIGSFAHEPKMLARWLIPSIILLLTNAAAGSRLVPSRWWTSALLGLHGAALLLTFSTSGFLVFMAALAVPPLAVAWAGATSARYVFAVGSIATFLISQNSGVTELFETVILSKSEKYDGFIQGGSDGPGILFLQEYPWSGLWGSGVATQGHYLPEFIPPEYEFVYQNVAERGFGGFGVESGWLSLLLDTGCIGVVLLLLAILGRWTFSGRLLQRLGGRPMAGEHVDAIVLTRCLLGTCLVGMVAYPLEHAGLLAVSLGLLTAAAANADRFMVRSARAAGATPTSISLEHIKARRCA